MWMVKQEDKTMTWTRKELKEKGKKTFKKNYWKCVLVAIILAIVTGGVANGSSTSGLTTKYKNRSEYSSDGHSYNFSVGEDGVYFTEEQIDQIEDDLDMTDAEKDEFEDLVNDPALMDSLKDDVEDMPDGAIVAFVIIMAIVFILVFALIAAFAILIDVVFFNPIEMGCDRFFYKNLDEDAKVSNVLFAYDNNFKNTAKTLFFRDLYIGLWSLLLIIPGIVKSYEYRMIPYLLSENPDMTKEEAFEESKKLMTGNKWKAFVLDLSFIGWYILSLLTCGIVGIFFVNPYKASTNAALYEKLRYGVDFSEADAEA